MVGAGVHMRASEDVVLSAQIPGWVRFKPAADWIAEHRALALKPEFDRFIQNRTAISDREREALFREFQQYLQSSSR